MFLTNMYIRSYAAVHSFLRNKEAASAIEYAIVAAMVAAVIVVFSTPIGTKVKAIFNSIVVGLGGTAL